MQVRVNQPGDLQARPTLTAGATGLSLTEERLADPEAKPLFPNPWGTGEEDHLGKAIFSDRSEDLSPFLIMSDQRQQTHMR
jgi:hypothetical protein